MSVQRRLLASRGATIVRKWLPGCQLWCWSPGPSEEKYGNRGVHSCGCRASRVRAALAGLLMFTRTRAHQGHPLRATCSW